MTYESLEKTVRRLAEKERLFEKDHVGAGAGGLRGSGISPEILFNI